MPHAQARAADGNAPTMRCSQRSLTNSASSASPEENARVRRPVPSDSARWPCPQELLQERPAHRRRRVTKLGDAGGP
eukprot:9874797-Lingulodinium_polyedra.AAC.1